MAMQIPPSSSPRPDAETAARVSSSKAHARLLDRRLREWRDQSSSSTGRSMKERTDASRGVVVDNRHLEWEKRAVESEFSTVSAYQGTGSVPDFDKAKVMFKRNVGIDSCFSYSFCTNTSLRSITDSKMTIWANEWCLECTLANSVQTKHLYHLGCIPCTLWMEMLLVVSSLDEVPGYSDLPPQEKEVVDLTYQSFMPLFGRDDSDDSADRSSSSKYPYPHGTKSIVLALLKTVTFSKLPKVGDDVRAEFDFNEVDEEEWESLGPEVQYFLKSILNDATDLIPNTFNARKLATFIQTANLEPGALYRLARALRIYPSSIPFKSKEWTEKFKQSPPTNSEEVLLTTFEDVEDLLRPAFPHFKQPHQQNGIYARLLRAAPSKFKDAAIKKDSTSEFTVLLRDTMAVLEKLKLEFLINGYVGSSTTRYPIDRWIEDLRGAFKKDSDGNWKCFRGISVVLRELFSSVEAAMDAYEEELVVEVVQLAFCSLFSRNELNLLERVIYLVLAPFLSIINSQKAGEHSNDAVLVFPLLQSLLFDEVRNAANGLSLEDFKKVAMLNPMSKRTAAVETLFIGGLIQIIYPDSTDEELQSMLDNQEFSCNIIRLQTLTTLHSDDLSETAKHRLRFNSAIWNLSSFIHWMGYERYASGSTSPPPPSTFNMVVLGAYGWKIFLYAIDSLGIKVLRCARFGHEEVILSNENVKQVISSARENVRLGGVFSFEYEKCVFAVTTSISPLAEEKVNMHKSTAQLSALSLAIAAKFAQLSNNIETFVNCEAARRLLMIQYLMAEEYHQEGSPNAEELFEDSATSSVPPIVSTNSTAPSDNLPSTTPQLPQVSNPISSQSTSTSSSIPNSSSYPSNVISSNPQTSTSSSTLNASSNPTLPVAASNETSNDTPAKLYTVGHFTLKLNSANAGEEETIPDLSLPYVAGGDFSYCNFNPASYDFVRILVVFRLGAGTAIVPTNLHKVNWEVYQEEDEIWILPFLSENGLQFDVSNGRERHTCSRGRSLTTLRSLPSLDSMVAFDLMKSIGLNINTSLQPTFGGRRSRGAAYSDLELSEREVGLNTLLQDTSPPDQETLVFPACTERLGKVNLTFKIRFAGSIYIGGSQLILPGTLFNLTGVDINFDIALVFSRSRGGVCFYWAKTGTNALTVSLREILDENGSFKLLGVVDPFSLAVREATLTRPFVDTTTALMRLVSLIEEGKFIPSINAVLSVAAYRRGKFPVTMPSATPSYSNFLTLVHLFGKKMVQIA